MCIVFKMETVQESNNPCNATVWSTDCCYYHCCIVHTIAESWARCCLSELKSVIKDKCPGCNPPDKLDLLDMTEHDLCIMTPPYERIERIFDHLILYICEEELIDKIIDIYPYATRSSDIEIITNSDWISNLLVNKQDQHYQKVDFDNLKRLTIDYVHRFLPMDPNWLDDGRFIPEIHSRFNIREIKQEYWDILDKRSRVNEWFGVKQDNLPQW